MSAAYNMNNSISKTEPCGTEQMTWITLEETPRTRTVQYVLSDKYDTNHPGQRHLYQSPKWHSVEM